MDLTYTPRSYVRPRRTAVARYVAILGGCLVGYALLGRPFAYIGVPPLFIGEMLLLAGLAIAASSGGLGAALRAWPIRLWLVLAVWAVIRTVPYLGVYGLDAARDLMLVGYGAYAVIVAAVLLADPEGLRTLAERYHRFAIAFLAVIWLIYAVAKTVGDAEPSLPWAPGVGIFSAKGGDLMVHVTGIVAYLMMSGLRRSPAALAMAAFTAGIVMVSNRGGMVAFALGIGLVWLMRPSGTRAGRLIYAFAALLVVGVLVGPFVDLRVQGTSRTLSVEQIVENATSIFGSGSASLDGTKRWRLEWWGDIVDYTLFGDYLLTGKGFGVNLAVADGYSVSEEESLRSPHNGHMTVLARAGVPGVILWLLVHLVWFGAVLRAWLAARARDERRWMALYAWIAGFWVAAMVNASFDVFLEGPMGGIWVWSVIGVGIAAVRLRTTHPQLLDPIDLPFPPTHGPDRAPAPTYGW
ncbi:O-antigen ligase family protein [Rubrivirga sp. IMCC45206]|uniref:O-antigen ligase family protein n=1 Tax=Rubrivirga sp. IMCC45206 TaxID=3391614 RepID=UPI00399003E2